MNDLDEKVRIKIISITHSGDEVVRDMVGHIDGVEFIYSDSVDDEMKIRKVLDGARLSTLVFLITGIECETDTQVISKISNFTEITHELGVLTIAIASASSPKLENKYNDLFATFLCHIDESKTANEVLLESVKSLADLLTHPGIVACDISLFIYTLFAPDSMAFICTETAIGENRAKDVTTKLLNCPLLNNVNLDAAGVYMLVCISTASTLSVLEYEEVTSILGMFQESGSTTMKAGTSINPDLADDEMKVTIAITNIKKYNDESWWDDDDDDNIDEIPAFLRPQLTRKNKMKIEFLNAQQVGTKLNELLDCTERFYCAVAWASDMTFADGLLENEDKICQLVIGTDYLGTAPEVLQSLKSVPKVRVMLKGQATFHPKIYCFIKDKNFFAIVGSSNLTNGGLSSNEEASVLIEGTTEDDFFKEISNKISSWWEMGVQIEDNWLSRYEEMWSKNKENRAKTKKLVDAIQEPPTIAEFNVKNSPRIRIALWVENIDKDNYSEEVPQDGEFLDEMAFLKNDDIEKGDWILSWKCKKDGNPYKSRMNWMYVDKIFLNGYKHCDYLKLAVQTKQNDLVPFRLDDGKLQSIIKEVIKSDDFAFNSENCYPTPAVVINFLTRVKLEYENSSK